MSVQPIEHRQAPSQFVRRLTLVLLGVTAFVVVIALLLMSLFG